MWPPHSGDEFALLDACQGTWEPEPCSMSLTHRGLCKLLAPTRRCVGGVESTYGAVHLPGGGGGDGPLWELAQAAAQGHGGGGFPSDPLAELQRDKCHRITPGQVVFPNKPIISSQNRWETFTVRLFHLLNYSTVSRSFTKTDLLILTKMPPRSLTNLGNAQGRLISWNRSYWRKSPSRLAPNYDTFDSHSRTTGKHVSFVSVKLQTEFHHQV